MLKGFFSYSRKKVVVFSGVLLDLLVTVSSSLYKFSFIYWNLQGHTKRVFSDCYSCLKQHYCQQCICNGRWHYIFCFRLCSVATFACMLNTKLYCNDEKNSSCKLVYTYYNTNQLQVTNLFVATIVNVPETHYFCTVPFLLAQFGIFCSKRLTKFKNSSEILWIFCTLPKFRQHILDTFIISAFRFASFCFEIDADA